MNQIIIHVDMDTFYAIVEMRDNKNEFFKHSCSFSCRSVSTLMSIMTDTFHIFGS